MRPEATTAPERIFVGRGVVFDTSADDLGTPRPEMEVDIAFDFEAVVGIRTYVTSGPNATVVPSRCVVDTVDDLGFTVLAPFDEVARAWLAHRRHADQMGRLRN